MYRCLLFTALVCVCYAGPATASWTVARTADFEVYSDAGSETARATLDWFEQLRAFFSEHTRLGTKAPAPVRVIVFRTPDEYAEYRPDPSVAAFYVGNS